MGREGVGLILSIRAQDVVGLRELRINKGELIDRRGNTEARHVRRQQLFVERVGGDLRLQLVVHLRRHRHHGHIIHPSDWPRTHHAHALILHISLSAVFLAPTNKNKIFSCVPSCVFLYTRICVYIYIEREKKGKEGGFVRKSKLVKGEIKDLKGDVEVCSDEVRTTWKRVSCSHKQSLRFLMWYIFTDLLRLVQMLHN